MKNIIGIDPGKNGSIVMLWANGNIDMFKMPETPRDLYEILYNLRENSVCFLERLWGMPGMGGTHMFTMGKGYGWIEMALQINEIKTESVLAQKWQKYYSVGTKGKNTTSKWKNILRAKAQEIFPKEKITLQFSDALLIAEYGRRTYK